jgi:hypothetical protein
VVTMSEQRPWDLEREILDLIAPARPGAPGSSHPDMRLVQAQPRGHREGTHRLRTRPKLNHAGTADRDDSGLKALASLLAEKPSLEVT